VTWGQQVARVNGNSGRTSPPRTAPRRFRRDRGRTAAQPPQQDRFDLIVFMMRSHDVLRAAAFLHFTEPGISRSARFCLRCLWPELQLRSLEWQLYFVARLATDRRTV